LFFPADSFAFGYLGAKLINIIETAKEIWLNNLVMMSGDHTKMLLRYVKKCAFMEKTV
jgi:hypothetical protein